jgi:NADH:ubiquinone oxidoreductase subunit
MGPGPPPTSGALAAQGSLVAETQLSLPGMEPVMKWVTSTAKMLMSAPPKLYNPSYLTIERAMKRFNEVMRSEGGFGMALNKARMETTFRKGTFVGTDYNGNKYYEDRDAPYGRTRWVEYPTPPGWFAIDNKFDGSMVSPEWHGWLHYTHDKTGPEMVRARLRGSPLFSRGPAPPALRSDGLASPHGTPRPLSLPQVAQFEKPFKQAHTINQSFLRPEFSRDGLDDPIPPAFHQPPGAHRARVERGRIGPKYESWGAAPNPQRNFADNSKTLHIP